MRSGPFFRDLSYSFSNIFSCFSEFANKAPDGLKALPWEEISQLVFEQQSVGESRARLVAKVT